MHRTPFVFFLFAAAAFAQSQAAADPLQALLAEVHQLRIDLQATTLTAQRVQILLYRVQLQQTTAAQAGTHADEMRSRLTGAKQNRTRSTVQLQRVQDAIEHNTDPNIGRQLQENLSEAKQQLEMWQNEEQQWQARDIEAQSQLRTEQNKLNDLQDTLDKLDKALANLTKQ